jgi:hypothetical protein
MKVAFFRYFSRFSSLKHVFVFVGTARDFRRPDTGCAEGRSPL